MRAGDQGKGDCTSREEMGGEHRGGEMTGVEQRWEVKDAGPIQDVFLQALKKF